MSNSEPVGVELTEAMAVTLCREACMNYSPDDVRGCTDCWTVAKVLAETVAARQAPTVALDVETAAAELFALGPYCGDMCGEWVTACAWCKGHYGSMAGGLIAVDPRRTEAEVKAEARERIVRAIAGSVPCGCELRHDGSEDPIAAAYVQALGDAARIAAGAPDA